MTWPDVIRSVTARIHDVAAQDRELRVLYTEEHMPAIQADAVILSVHCGLCHWDSMVIAAEPMDAQRAYEVCCLHCGATDPEVVDVRRLPRRDEER